MALQWFSFPMYQRREKVVRLRSLLALVVVLGLAGCGPQLPSPPPMPDQSVPQLPSQSQVARQLQQLTKVTYTISPGDVIGVQVEGKPALSREVTVDADGAFRYPHVGKIQAAGLTLTQLENQMGQQLAKTSHKPPKLKTTMVKQRSQYINILGEVRIPGLHPIQPNATLLDVLAQAGGPTPHAGWIGLVIKNHGHPNGATASHHGEAELTLPIRFDLERLIAGADILALPLNNGDTVYIPEAGEYFVYGEVRHPGQYRLRRDTTVIKAITRAGGFTSFASKNDLRLWRYHVHNEHCGGELCLWGTAKRIIDEPPEQFRVRLHDRIQPGDVVVAR